MDQWWDRQERLEWELQALEAEGYDYEVVAGDSADQRELHIRIPWEIDGERRFLEVYFPEFYPYFRFQIALEEGQPLPHHHNPFAGFLCVLDRPTSEWKLNDTLVDFLRSRVPRAVEAGQAQDAEAVEGEEVQQAEPFSNYYLYAPNYILLINGDWEIPEEVQRGRLVLGYFSDPPSPPLRLLIREVQDEDGNTLAELPEAVDRHCAGTRYGRWLKLEEPIQENDANRFFEVAAGHDHEVRAQDWQAMQEGRFKLVATLFPEEQAWRDEGEGTGWVAAIRENKRIGDRPPPGQRDGRPRRTETRLVRAGRVGRGDLLERIPELTHMVAHTVAVVGLGGLGAPASLQFARTGAGQLNLIDPDFVDPATMVRWPFGLRAAGAFKTHALAGFIENNFPYTDLKYLPLRIGRVRQETGTQDWEVLEECLAQASLIFDATAEHGVQRFLSEYARRNATPYVWVEGRQGGWGGLVGEVPPGDDVACWGCIEAAQAAGDITPPPAAPDAQGRVQPQGCGDPTFTGAGFDMSLIAQAAVRRAIGILSRSDEAYPPSEGNLEVLHLRNGDRAVMGSEVHDVERRDDCPVCAS